MSKNISGLREIAKKNRLLRYIVRKYRARTQQPDWSSLLAKNSLWQEALRSARDGRKILLPTSIGAYLSGTTFESLLAVALTIRGAYVETLLCDTVLPACFECWIGWYKKQQHFAEHGPKKDLCQDCFHYAAKMYTELGIHIHRYSNLLTAGEIAKAKDIADRVPLREIEQYQEDGIVVGEHALAGALRFYARGDLESEPYAAKILRRYFGAALLTTWAMRNLLAQVDYQCAVFHHGIYVPQGLIGEVCRQRGVRVVNWNPAYRNKSFILSHGNTYHHTMMNEDVNKWETLSWTRVLDRELVEYLKSRWQGNNDWIWFHEHPQFDLQKFALEAGIDLNKPCIGLLTSVMWDACLHYPANAFPNMLSWVFSSIDYFSKRRDLQLIIRIHPAEIRGTLPSRQKILDEIRNKYAQLPENIIIIPPESKMSTYAVMMQCNAVIIYNTKTGVELSAMGIPVIVAGEAWIRNKGFALDVHDKHSYHQLLSKLPLPEKMSASKIEKARKYAYHFFFRRMIPLEFMAATGSNPPFKIKIDSLRDLMPGQSTGLDIICKGILDGSDFIYPAETIAKQGACEL